MSDSTAMTAFLDAIYGRVGEVAPKPRLAPTRRALELLGDPHRSYPIVHLTGTNGKTSTSRITESLLRAHGLRTGLFTSPDLGRLNERIVVDGEPISDERLLEAWADITPYLEMTDRELEAAGEPSLTFFEALTVLAYAAFADTPIDVGVIEVGMGGEWDATNVADGQVAVFTPIDLDHTQRLGSTVDAIARTKSGIIKPGRSVVSARQHPEALAELERAAELNEADVTLEDRDFRVLGRTPAVVPVGSADTPGGTGASVPASRGPGQVVDVQGRAGRYERLFVPLLGAHQAENTAVAIAAVETFVGGGKQPIAREVLDEGLAQATSPGRMQVVSSAPTLVVDAAHNPHGAAALAAALTESFSFSRLVAVLAVLGDKDAAGIIRAVEGVVDDFVVTTAPSDRTTDPDELARTVVGIVGADRVVVEPDLERALETARELAVDAPVDEGRAGGVVAFGSITLIAKVLQLAGDDDWSAP
ncbi:bifunctional folylpolyglutamate synthase/dihydrofolate synthase [Amnibacterium sp. CER49]|uniref:bifunctional folylpolyglutamate synthase/dihydrofolate synthase n=1 Tax=Amnibacterium sp. CER49 TaxID=3039161 RepID=UPI0024469385|nr:bifunctional folylpolyglutamate synthase/dihydrofolate synthase [Amnibacterium sp. CER49]MDH2442501.1 bifunctional folylpolyglutamate synthase/dihydrofolate synthase [Amnibacterium sp. CER49]